MRPTATACSHHRLYRVSVPPACVQGPLSGCPCTPAAISSSSVTNFVERVRDNTQTSLAQQKPLRRQTWTAASAKAAEQESAQAKSRRDEEVAARVEAVATRIDEMVVEINKELLTEQTAAEIMGEAADDLEAEVVGRAVSKHLEELDEAFLAVLNMYIRAANAKGDLPTAARLLSIQREVLRCVRQTLAPDMQILDTLLPCPSRKQRREQLHALAGGAPTHLPACAMDRLQQTASRLIDDMEENPLIVDRRLLARLCLLREEVEDVAAQSDWNLQEPDEEGEGAPANLQLHFQEVPKRAAAFLKELLNVTDGSKRRALLEKAFREDWDMVPLHSRDGPRFAGELDKDVESVRPGRFMTCINAFQLSLVERGTVDEKVMKQLLDVRKDALFVLDQIAYD